MNDLVQMTFDYSLLDESTRVFLKVKAESIRTRLKRTAEDIVAIGQDLIDVKAKLREDNNHKRGLFQGWLDTEFSMTDRTARHFMQVADRFRGEITEKFSDISVSVLYELASPSTPDQIVAGVLSGEIPAESKAVKEAKEALRKAEEAKLEAEKAKRETQQELDLFKKDRERERADKQRELDIKTKELELFKWQKELEDSKHEAQQKQLQQDIDRLKQEKVQTIQEDTPETKAKLEDLEKQLKEIEAQKKNLADDKKEQDNQLKQKTDRVKVLTDQIKQYNAVNKQEKHNEKIRDKCRQMCDAYSQGRNLASTRMVTATDAQQAFSQEEWAMIAEEEAALRRAADELARLKESVTSQFVDVSPVVEAPLFFIEAESHAI